MRILIILAGTLLFMVSGADNAEAACVEKKNGDAHLIALVPDNDRGRFASQGFAAATCPDNYADNPELAEGWCNSFTSMAADRRTRFSEKFGITTTQVCQAARDYFAAR